MGDLLALPASVGHRSVRDKPRSQQLPDARHPLPGLPCLRPCVRKHKKSPWDLHPAERGVSKTGGGDTAREICPPPS